MAILSRRILFAAAGIIALCRGASAQTADEPARVMDRYAAALRASNAEALVALYADNGVFIRPDFAPAIGREALRAAYREIVATLRADLTFDVKEIEMAGDIAWLRSSSAGTVKVLKTGVVTKDQYNQVVVLRRERGSWKIRSYIYAPATAATPTRT